MTDAAEYTYDVRVVETVEYSTTIASDRPMSFRELSDAADARVRAGMRARVGDSKTEHYLARVDRVERAGAKEAGNGSEG